MRLTTLQSRRDRIIAGLTLATLSWAVLLIPYFGKFLESYELKTYDQLCRFDARDAENPGIPLLWQWTRAASKRRANRE